MIWTDRSYSLPMLMFWRKGRLSFKGFMAYAYDFFLFFSDCPTELFNLERPAIGPIIMTKSTYLCQRIILSAGARWNHFGSGSLKGKKRSVGSGSITHRLKVDVSQRGSFPHTGVIFLLRLEIIEVVRRSSCSSRAVVRLKLK